MRVTCLKAKLVDTSNSGLYQNLKGEPLSEVVAGQTFECQDDKARELMHMGYVALYEVPRVAYEVTMFGAGILPRINIETKEGHRLAGQLASIQEIGDGRSVSLEFTLDSESRQSFAEFAAGLDETPAGVEFTPVVPAGDGDLSDAEPGGMAAQGDTVFSDAVVPESGDDHSGRRGRRSDDDSQLASARARRRQASAPR